MSPAFEVLFDRPSRPKLDLRAPFVGAIPCLGSRVVKLIAIVLNGALVVVARSSYLVRLTPRLLPSTNASEHTGAAVCSFGVLDQT
jgi:hypothetical protein